MLQENPSWVRDLAFSVGKSKILKKILNPIYSRFKTKIIENRVAVFHRNSLSMLARFDEIMTKNGYSYFLMYGTLLGAVREHGFIKHDFDIDVGINYSDFSEGVIDCLIKAGFKREYSFIIGDGSLGREETLSYLDVHIDIFIFYFTIGNLPYACSWIPESGCSSWEGSMRKYGYVVPKRYHTPLSQTCIRVPFESLTLPVPSNYKDILVCTYGVNYMIPDPNFVPLDDDPNIILWREQKAIYKHY